MARKNILSQMFDVRPLNRQGNLDLERIKKIRQLLDLAEKTKVYLKLAKDYEASRLVNLREEAPWKIYLKKPIKKRKSPGQIFSDEQVLKSLLGGGRTDAPAEKLFYPSRDEILATLQEIEELSQVLQTGGLEEDEIAKSLVEELKTEIVQIKAEDLFDLDELLKPQAGDILASTGVPEEEVLPEAEILTLELPEPEPAILVAENFFEPNVSVAVEESTVVPLEKNRVADSARRWRKIFGQRKAEVPRREAVPLGKKNLVWRGAGFVSAGFVIWLVIFGLSLAGQGLSVKSSIMNSGLSAYQAMLAGKDSARSLDFSGAQNSFETAYQNFLQADDELDKMGGVLISVLEALPVGSAVKSAGALIETGKDLAQVGTGFSRLGNLIVPANISAYFSGGQSLTQKIIAAQTELQTVGVSLNAANQNLANVNVADLPSNLAPQVQSLKDSLPVISRAVAAVNDWSSVFLKILGHEQAKKYLLVFQNNAEARPTGGFIGTYGVLDLDEGQIKNLKIDGIFNLDGQLYEKVVPPKPIQKISTAWSTHDANWFADFPTSAQKVMGFYESAGGATPDGVISLTPTAIERLLAITGPIDLPEYNVTLDENNFAELIQYKVEADYDKELNQPKKILSDFAPKFLARLWEVWPQKYDEIIQSLTGSLAEKQILFYFSDPALEKTFEQQGWTGEILSTDKDYLSVVNTNINGFKTDKMIQQKIEHESALQPDGSIVDTVKITRAHAGGQSQYDWYNKVNADYLRVYVPAGSQLLSARGQTLENNKPPADYQALKFKIDPDVQTEEQSMQTDKSGTQIFLESGKTVFGNWVYVSPGETMEVTYKYLLPFKLDLSADNFTYSLLAQKQSGSINDSGFTSALTLPQDYNISWKYPDNLQISGSQVKFTGDLKTDRFYGLVFGQ